MKPKKLGLTRKTRLADLPPPPVQVVALSADPVARLVRDGTAVTRVEDGRCDADDVGRPDLRLLRKGLVVRPVHDTRIEGVAGDVLHPSPDGKRAPTGGEERVTRFLGEVLHGSTGNTKLVAAIINVSRVRHGISDMLTQSCARCRDRSSRRVGRGRPWQRALAAMNDEDKG